VPAVKIAGVLPAHLQTMPDDGEAEMMRVQVFVQ